MNNDDQSCIPMEKADNNLNTNSSGIFNSLEKYTPIVDTLRGYFVQSLEKRICDGLEIFLYNNGDLYNNLSSQIIPCVKKFLDINGDAVKYLLRDGIAPCIVNAIVINNRLNKISRDLDSLGMEKNFLQYININNYIYPDEYWLTYDDNNNTINNINNHESQSFRSYYTTSDSSNFDNEIESKYKYSQRINDSKIQNFPDYIPRKPVNIESSIYTNSKIEQSNFQNISRDKILEMVVKDCNNHKIYHMIELPCNYQCFINHINDLIDLSWKNSSSVGLSAEFKKSINDTCAMINEKLDSLDDMSIKRCRLYCIIYNDCIYIELKMMNTDGSKIFLFNDQIYQQNNSSKILNSRNNDKLSMDKLGKMIKTKPILERITEEANSEKNNSTSKRSSFRTINEYPLLESFRKITPTGNSFPSNGSANGNGGNDDDDDDDDDTFSHHNNCDGEEYENIMECSCSLHNCYDYWEYCDSKCVCDLSCEGTYYSARNLLECNSRGEKSPTISHKSFVNLSASTPVGNVSQEVVGPEMINDSESSVAVCVPHSGIEVIQTNDLTCRDDDTALRESRISDALSEILEASARCIPCRNKKLESTSIQTSECNKLLDSQIKSSLSPNVSSITFIATSNNVKDQKQKVLEGIKEVEEVEKKVDEIGQIEKKFIVEKIVQIDDYRKMKVPNFISHFTMELNSPLKISSPPPPPLGKLKKTSKKISKNMQSSVRTQCCRSSTIILSSCRPSKKSKSTSPIIKYPREGSEIILNKYSYEESFSDVSQQHGNSNFHTIGDSSMNNLYNVCPNKRRYGICHCKKYKIITERRKIHSTRKETDHYLPSINKNAKSILSSIRRRFKIVFSLRSLRKLKYVIKKKLSKLMLKHEKTMNISHKDNGKVQNRQRSLCSHCSINNSSMNMSNNKSSRYNTSETIDNDEPKYHGQSSSQNFYSSYQQIISPCHNENYINHESEFKKRQRLLNFITDNKHQIVNDKLINRGKILCQCGSCHKLIGGINHYQSTDNSILSFDNKRRKFSSNYQQIKQTYLNNQQNEYTTKILSSSSSSSPPLPPPPPLPPSPPLSLSSKKNYFCCYHKIFAAINLNQLPLDDSYDMNYRSISDELDIDCGECFGPTDHNFRLMLNQYINLCTNTACSSIKYQHPYNYNSSRTISSNTNNKKK